MPGWRTRPDPHQATHHRARAPECRGAGATGHGLAQILAYGAAYSASALSISLPALVRLVAAAYWKSARMTMFAPHSGSPHRDTAAMHRSPDNAVVTTS